MTCTTILTVEPVHTGPTAGICGGAVLAAPGVADNGGPHECPPQPFWTGVAMAPCFTSFPTRWTYSPHRFMQVPTNADFRSLSDTIRTFLARFYVRIRREPKSVANFHVRFRPFPRAPALTRALGGRTSASAWYLGSYEADTSRGSGDAASSAPAAAGGAGGRAGASPGVAAGPNVARRAWRSASREPAWVRRSSTSRRRADRARAAGGGEGEQRGR